MDCSKSMQRRKDDESGPVPIVNWLANHDGNTQIILKKVRENRRRQILQEQDRKERKRVAKKIKRKKRKDQQNNPDKRHGLTTYFKSTGKTVIYIIYFTELQRCCSTTIRTWTSHSSKDRQSTHPGRVND